MGRSEKNRSQDKKAISAGEDRSLRTKKPAGEALSCLEGWKIQVTAHQEGVLSVVLTWENMGLGSMATRSDQHYRLGSKKPNLTKGGLTKGKTAIRLIIMGYL